MKLSNLQVKNHSFENKASIAELVRLPMCLHDRERITIRFWQKQILTHMQNSAASLHKEINQFLTALTICTHE